MNDDYMPSTEPEPVPDDKPVESKALNKILNAYELAGEAAVERIAIIDFCSLALRGNVGIAQIQNSNVVRIVLDQQTASVKSKDNKLKTANRAYKRKMQRALQQMKIRPATEVREDIDKALVGESFYDMIWETMELGSVFTRWIGWIPRAGAGILHTCWDELAGPDTMECGQCGTNFSAEEYSEDDPCPTCSAEAMDQQASMQQEADMMLEMGLEPEEMPEFEVPNLVKKPMGDVSLKVIDPRKFFPDPGATRLQEVKYAFVTEVLPVPDLRDMFPGKKIQKEDGLFYDQYLKETSGEDNNCTFHEKKLDNHAQLIRGYFIATKKHPNGRVVSIINNRIVDEKELLISTKIKRLPFFFAQSEDVDGDLWQDPIINEAYCAQVEYERALNQLRRHTDITIDPPILNPINSRINKKTLREMPGRVIDYVPGTEKPKQWNPKQLPAYVIQMTDGWVDIIYEKFCVTAQDLASVPLSGESGRVRALTDSKSDSLITTYSEPTLTEWKQAAQAIIILGQLFYSAERAWTIVGRDKVSYVTKSWNVTMKPGWSVYLSGENAFSNDPAIKLDQALNLLTRNPSHYADPMTGQYDDHKFCLDAGLKTFSSSRDLKIAARAYAENLPTMVKEALQGGREMPVPRFFDSVPEILEALSGWLQTEGRSEDPQLVHMVEQLWIQYSATMPQIPQLMEHMPNQGMVQQQAQQQGQQAVPHGTDDPAANSNIASADAAGEQAASQNLGHEKGM